VKDLPKANLGKFQDSQETADGSDRASVAFSNPETLWFNTGTLCNIECENCYILSSPTNDALVYLTTAEVEGYLDQIKARDWPIREIGFTGGEPFMNPDIIDMIERAASRGFEVLVLTNAMRPMMRKQMRAGLLRLQQAFPGKLTLRVSLDHYCAEKHDAVRGQGSFSKSIEGMIWLRDTGVPMTVAGRTLWDEDETTSRQGYAALYQEHDFDIDAYNLAKTVLFPEMDEQIEVPEITTACWGILNKSPTDVMCSSSRMVVKRKGAATPAVIACTLLPYAEEFELGATLEDAEREVYLNHPHCAKFCVLGGASCSA